MISLHEVGLELGTEMPGEMARRDILPAGEGIAYLVAGALSPAECAGLVRWAEDRGFHSANPAYPPWYRNNDRLVIDDPRWAERLFARLRPHLPAELEGPDGTRWSLQGLNERFRFCRYDPGQRFSRHRDGVYHRSADEQSRLTFMVYLNGASAFAGGATEFLRGSEPGAAVSGRVEPAVGSLAVFSHDLWHRGETVTAGRKYIMRSDILYRREPSPARAARPAPRAHRGYVWSVAALDDGRLVSGGRDRSIRLWSSDASREVLRHAPAHAGSVLALAVLAPGLIASGSRDGEIRWWEIGSRHGAGGLSLVRARRDHAGAVLRLVALPDRALASASADGTVRVYGARNGEVRLLRGHRGWVWALARLDDGRLISGGDDGTIREWHGSGLCLRVHDVGGGGVMALAPAPAEGWVSGHADGSVRLWRHGRLVARWRGHRDRVRDVAHLDGGVVVSGGDDSVAYLWREGRDQPVAVIPHGDAVSSVTPRPGGGWASGSYDGGVRVWPRP